MTAPADAPPLAPPDPTRCPGCGGGLTTPPAGVAACLACGLTLSGPPAQRLWQVDVALWQLETSRRGLLGERRGLLTALRRVTALRRTDLATAAPVVTAGTGASTGGTPAVPAGASGPAREWTPKRVQNLLLALGGLLLAVAALVFAAVTYDRLGASGRAVVLGALTALAVTGTPLLRRRGLQATAETVGVVAVALGWLDAYGLRSLGLAADVGGPTYYALSALVLAALAGALALAVRLQWVGVAAVLLAQLPVPLLLIDAASSAVVSSLCFTALALADLAALAIARGTGLARLVRRALVVAAGLTGLVALWLALISADGSETATLGPATALGAVAGLLALGAVLAEGSIRTALAAGPIPLVALATAVAVGNVLPPQQLVVAPALVAVAAALGALVLRRDVRTGPVAGALIVTGTCLASVGEQIVSGLLLPLTWLLEPWTLDGAPSARAALAPAVTWDGSGIAPLVLVAAAAAVVAAGLALHHPSRRPTGEQQAGRGIGPWALAVPAAGALVLVALALLPLALDLDYRAALAGLLALSIGSAALSLRAPASRYLALQGASAAVLGLALGWSSANQGATLVVLALAALLAGTVAVLTGRTLRGPLAVLALPWTAVTGLLAAGCLGALGAARDLAGDQIGGLLLAAVVLLVAGSALLHRIDALPAHGLEVAAAVSAGAAVVLSAGDAGWLSWVLAGTGLVVLALALQPHRRACAVAGALLLSASSAVRLLDAGVTAPEPYLLPLAALALLLGWLRRRTEPSTRSWAAYAPGLGLLLLPSLVASLSDATPTRGLVLGGVALLVLLLGARARLQAPLVLGGGVLAVDALVLLAPYAAALPRWSTIGAAGVLLVAVGATFEQRRRDVERLRRSYDGLT